MKQFPKAILPLSNAGKNLSRKMKREFEPLLNRGYEGWSQCFKSKKVFPERIIKLEFSSTILIPDQYMDFSGRKYMNIKEFGHILLTCFTNYRLHIANGIVPSYSSVTTKYQRKGQDLQKISFRPRKFQIGQS